MRLNPPVAVECSPELLDRSCARPGLGRWCYSRWGIGDGKYGLLLGVNAWGFLPWRTFKLPDPSIPYKKPSKFVV
ncbi:hypothetical protein [Marinobacter psychrophilus]|jgi:hypothetical protein|uniref:hypothetical protein n=1 Tax=Marinobacter psychrophilus TaxID=330734 RepID=UPI002352D7D4|nr:hypothetical protein [Marinobacter psychrophilus]